MSKTKLGAFLFLIFLTLLAAQADLPGATAQDAAQVTVDQSQANHALAGRVVSSSETSARIVVKNPHLFWTNLEETQGFGTVSLKPANWTDLQLEDFGGLYASAGVLAPGAEATWDWAFDLSRARSTYVSVFVSPSYKSINGQEITWKAPVANLVTIILKALGQPLGPSEAQGVVKALKSLWGMPKVMTCAQAINDQDPFTFAQDFYELVSDNTQAKELAEILTDVVGKPITEGEVKRLSQIWTIQELVRMTWDMGQATVLDQAVGSVDFTASGAPGQGTPLATPATAPATGTSSENLIGYRESSGAVVIRNLDTGETVRTISPPEEGIKSFAVSADLSTQAWVPNAQPWRLMVKQQGQQARAVPVDLNVVRRLAEAAGYLPPNFDVSGTMSDEYLSPRGNPVAVGPVAFGADGWAGGSLIMDTDTGKVVKMTGAPEGVAISSDGALAAGVGYMRGNLGAGVSESRASVESLVDAASATASRLSASIEALHSDWHSDGTVAYLTSPILSWRGDSKALALAETRREVNPQGECNSVDRLVLVDASGAKVIYQLPSVDLGKARDPGSQFPTCDYQNNGLSLGGVALSPDGTRLIYEEDQRAGDRFSYKVTKSTLWVMNLDGSGRKQVAEGTMPFWVVPSAH